MDYEAAEEIYNNERRGSEATEYLKASVIVLSKIFGEQRNEAAPAMLALLLSAEVVFLNSHWWEKEWPEDARETVALCVNCNDVFAWACSDAEDLTHDEIPDLFDHWLKDPDWGPSIWCMKKRNQMPQKPVEAQIRKAGIWDMDAILLPPNTQDAQVHAIFAEIRKAT